MHYYVGSIPVSDELYHHGIKGQKWGVRRYQNLDRTLTPAGKLRYAAGKAGNALGIAAKATGSGLAKFGKATGRAARAVARRQVDKVKQKHLWMMSDDELDAYTKRLTAEKNYKDALNNYSTSRGQKMSQRILENGGDILSRKIFEAIGNSIVNRANYVDQKAYAKKMSKQQAKNKARSDRMVERREKLWLPYRNDPSEKYRRQIKKSLGSFTDEQVDAAAKRIENLRKIENRYRGTPIGGGGGKGKKGGGK